ncbi:DUF2189 domain-containing protein [Roseomonas nepalensis]|uniref:DUF2189 domain-containing protein n=1 Tax=Muricoccus nepalensis TaxID=1854500 RepID=A0A502GA54_9PROT|nr:DUF2189 domain-containing protein [Roseomonas nepalensis]TPG58531.1 DUF2189 domain-containing protein [Roseomonas nepalensis]
MVQVSTTPVTNLNAYAEPTVRRIGTDDVWSSLSQGWRDFLEVPTQLFFLAIIYPAVGLVLGFAAAGGDMLSVIWPLTAGFALLGPITAVGIYEMSRRREQGLPVHWMDALAVFRSAGLGSIIGVGIVLLALFVAWIVTAQWIYHSTIGPDQPSSLSDLWRVATGTPEGWRLMTIGNITGFVFAVVALSVSVVSIPLLLERDVGPVAAIRTSLRAVATNPVPMGLWGLLVAGLLLAGSIPLFVGLAVVMPVLGHATWHLYRKVVG